MVITDEDLVSDIEPVDSASNLTNKSLRLTTSSALQHFFDKPPKNFNYKTTKLRCHACLKMVTGNPSTTHNLQTHAKTHHLVMWDALMSGEPIQFGGPAQKTLEHCTSFLGFKPFSQEDFNQDLIEWIIDDEQSFLVFYFR